MSQTDPYLPALRKFSKAALKRSYRIEVAAAISRLAPAPIHATRVHDHLRGTVPFNKISEEINEYAEWGLLRRVRDESRHAGFETADTAFFRMAAELEREALKRAERQDASAPALSA